MMRVAAVKADRWKFLGLVLLVDLFALERMMINPNIIISRKGGISSQIGYQKFSDDKLISHSSHESSDNSARLHKPQKFFNCTSSIVGMTVAGEFL